VGKKLFGYVFREVHWNKVKILSGLLVRINSVWNLLL